MTKAEQTFQQAFALHQTGKVEEAEAIYRQILKKTPSDTQTLYLLGTACSQQGKHDEAQKYFEKALKLNPRHVEAMNNLGLALKGQNKLEEAISYFRRALELKPDYDDAHGNLAVCLESLDRLDEAETHARRALELNPNHSGACFSLGLILKRKDRFEESVQYLWRGLELKPDIADAYNDLGAIYKLWGRYEESLSCLERALALEPDKYASLNNLGATLEEMGRLEEALQVYERAAEVNSGDRTARWNCSLLYIRLGMLDKGWEEYELRFSMEQARGHAIFPLWDGSSLAEKTIAICAEQGLGDEILFASCFPDVIAQAGHCVIQCDPRLVPLYARSFPTATVFGSPRDQFLWPNTVKQIDCQVFAGSLPKYFRRNLESFPDKPAYLVADPAKVEYSRSRLAAVDAGLRVGICWRSGLVEGERFKYYSELSQWGEIFKVEGVHFVNLQYGECSEELREAEEKFGVKITNFADLDMKNNIDGTAALIASLDLVISAATAVSEIAGALGVEVYRPEAHAKAWTSLGTDNIPWHPSMKLFYQPANGDWETPLALIAQAVREKVQGNAKKVEYLHLSSGLEIALKDSLEDISCYVLQEQDGWFDQEYGFIQQLAKPGMRMVDIGSGIGAYAAPMAKSGARVWALAKTAAEVDLLLKTRMKNQLKKNLNVSIIDWNAPLDTEMNRYGLDNISFARIATEVATSNLFHSGNLFFSLNSPLLMFGIRANEEIGIANGLAEMGYGLFRFVPGLKLLVPFASKEDLDVFSLNLFACKPDRAQLLEEEGLLVRQLHALDAIPATDSGYWQEYLKEKPYASGMAENPGKEKDWEVYWMALNLFAQAKAKDASPAVRYACLQTAAGIMHSLAQESANVERLLSLCRMTAELGMREATVNLLNHLCSALDSAKGFSLTEPFLALSEAYENRQSEPFNTAWIVSMILEQRERLRAFSSFFTGKESLPVLKEIEATGFLSEDMKKRIELIEKRFEEKAE